MGLPSALFAAEMIYGFGFFKVNYLKFSLEFVNYYFITNFFWPSLSKFFPTYPFCTFSPGYLLKNMERMYRLCKESLWKRSELSENCFHSVVVKIILINYARKKQFFLKFFF
jgi:hypothetical protein